MSVLSSSRQRVNGLQIRRGPLTFADVRSERIDVAAQRALLQMSRRPETSADANGLAREVRAERLAGIFQENRRAPALRAKSWGRGWWQVIPSGEDMTLLLSPDDPVTGPPMVVYRQRVNDLPAEMERVLRAAWAAYMAWHRRGRESVRCPAPGAGNSASALNAAPLANLTPPILCAAPSPPVDQILLVGVHLNTQLSTLLRFEISTDGGQAFQPVAVRPPGVALARLPSSPRPLAIIVRFTPENTPHWPAEGRFELQPSGDLIAMDERARTEFTLAAPVEVAGGGRAVVVTAVLSRVRDATARALAELGNIPRERMTLLDRPQVWTPSNWGTPTLGGLHIIGSPAVERGRPKFHRRTIETSSEEVVLEVAGVKAPQLVAVSWPTRVARVASAGPTPFFLYFHPTLEQAHRRGFYRGSYPFSYDYIFYGLWCYLNYNGDPLTIDPHKLGLPYQIAASGHPTVLVLPCSRFPDDLGELMHATFAAELLQEINAFMFRRARIFSPPPVGRTALGAFSSGNNLVTEFFSAPANRAHSFYRDTLQELYMFDAPIPGEPTRTIKDWTREALRWAATDSVTGKRIRAYTRQPDLSLGKLVGTGRPLRSPIQVSSADFRNTVTVLSHDLLVREARTRGSGRAWRSEDTHPLIAALMATDALLRSGFAAG